MRIGFFTDSFTPQINGVVRSILLFKEALEARGHELYVFAPDPEQDEDSEGVVRFRSLPYPRQPEMRMAAPISIEALRLLDKVDLDVVHSHDPFAIGLFGLQVARRHRVPYVNTYHTAYPEYVHYVWDTRLTKRFAEQVSRVFGEYCDSIVAPSTKIETYLREYGVTVPIEIIATGIDVAHWAHAEAEHVAALRRKLRLPAGERVILYMGRLGREKSVDTLIRAMWHSRRTDATLVIAGDGPWRGELETLAAELGVMRKVRFAGYLKGRDTVAAYQLADLFAFASTTETQGLVIGEAMAAGLPVVTGEDEAIEDFVDERSGIVVRHRPEDFARACDRILSDDALCARLSAGAVARAAEFSIDRQAAKLEAHYERAIEAYPKRRRLLRIPKSLLPGPLARIATALEDDRR